MLCSQTHNDKVIEYVEAQGLTVTWILETHVHADHLTGAQGLKARFPTAKAAIGEHVKEVQALFKGIFNLEEDFATDGSQFDVLLADGATFSIGSVPVRVLHTPGHTPACCSYVIGDAVFTGDTVFMPDMGSARCDFPKGSAEALFHSVRDKIFALADSTRVFVGHDYAPGGRPIAVESTIGAEKVGNKHLKESESLEGFVAARESRDKTLGAPRLLLPSLQVNLRNGQLPPAEANGRSYLKIPLTVVPSARASE